jgi:hypothetical protein
MKIINVKQNSLEWLSARAGLPTASEWDALISPKGEIRKGGMPDSYLARKVAEKWIGPLPGFSTLDMDFGRILEEEAIPWYELEFNCTITRVGLVTDEEGLIGCSPDGLLGDDCGLEIKCPNPDTHVKYLLLDRVPDDYIAQVQGSMLVTGCPRWQFVSYRRRFPKLVIDVERNEKFCAALAEALGLFQVKLENAWQRICDCNGGEPRRLDPLKAARQQAAAFDSMLKAVHGEIIP